MALGESSPRASCPAYVVESAAYYEPALAGSAPVRPVAVAGLDVVRDHEGRFRVLEDNVRTPSGIAYAVAARELMRARLPEPAEGLRGIDDAFALLADALRAAAPGGPPARRRLVVLTDGPENTRVVEHARSRGGCGCRSSSSATSTSPATGSTRGSTGARCRVDVVYRRTDEDRLIGADGRPTRVGRRAARAVAAGTVGLRQRLRRRGRRRQARPRLRRGDGPLLPRRGAARALRATPTTSPTPRCSRRCSSASTSWSSSPATAAAATASSSGPHADRRRSRGDARTQLRSDPEGYVAQEMVRLSRHPTVVDDRLEPRHVDLRAFVFLAGDHAAALAGGLTRVALDAGALVVNSSQNGGAKDTWVLA